MTSKSIAALIALFACAFVGIPAAVAQPTGVSLSATVNGQDVGAASRSDPLRLDPGESVEVAVELTNNGHVAVSLRRVELAGRVLGLTFFSYATTVALTVEPGSTDTLRYQLDLIGLEGQATGLIGAALTVTDGAGDPIALIPTVTDVRGSLISVYGLFGIALLVLTVLALLDAALALARHRLSQNRWQRGLRLLTPGVGVGLVLAFSASVGRWWVPDTGLWLVVAGLTAAVFFALGYFSPTPLPEEEFDEEEELEDGEMFDEDADRDAPPDADTLSAKDFGR